MIIVMSDYFIKVKFWNEPFVNVSTNHMIYISLQIYLYIFVYIYFNVHAQYSQNVTKDIVIK